MVNQTFITVYIRGKDLDRFERLCAIARKRGLSRSAFVREAMSLWGDKYDRKGRQKKTRTSRSGKG